MQSECHICSTCIYSMQMLCMHTPCIVLWTKGRNGILGEGLPFFCHGPICPRIVITPKLFFSLASLVPVSFIYYNLDTTKRVLPNFAGYAEENSFVNYGNSFCYYNCTIDVSMAPQCRNHANISVSSSPPTANQSVLTPNGVNYNISALQRCQRYTVEVTAQVGAHKYTNQTQDTVMLRKSAH